MLHVPVLASTVTVVLPVPGPLVALESWQPASLLNVTGWPEEPPVAEMVKTSP